MRFEKSFTAVSQDRLQPCIEPEGDREALMALSRMRMPYGRYQGTLLIDLPESYVVWFANNVFTEGELGRMMQTLYVVKANGLEYLFDLLRSAEGHR